MLEFFLRNGSDIYLKDSNKQTLFHLYAKRRRPLSVDDIGLIIDYLMHVYNKNAIRELLN